MNAFKTSLFLALIIFINGCATLPTDPPLVLDDSQKTVQKYELKDLCAQYNVFWKWDSVSHVVTLRANNIQAKALVGSNVVLIGERKIILSEPIRTVQSSIIVPADFKIKVIDQLKQAATAKDKKAGYAISRRREVVIDAGHGGKDPGAIALSGTYEKDVVLDIARRVRDILKRKGVRVRMTRDSDEFISLKERTEIASQSEADLFVSVHANAHGSRSVHGVEVYAHKDLDFSERNEEQRKMNERFMFDHLMMKKNNEAVQGIVSDMLYVHKQAQSAPLAKKIADRTAADLQTKDLGDKYARFYVLRNTLIPAVLVEVGYLSNPKEDKLLQTKVYRRKVASSLADSILNYIDNE